MTPQPTYRGNWVSVKERLPHWAFDCIVTTSDKNQIEAWYQKGVWFDRSGNIIKNATHWLELKPLPPMPEKD